MDHKTSFGQEVFSRSGYLSQYDLPSKPPSSRDMGAGAPHALQYQYFLSPIESRGNQQSSPPSRVTSFHHPGNLSNLTSESRIVSTEQLAVWEKYMYDPYPKEFDDLLEVQPSEFDC